MWHRHSFILLQLVHINTYEMLKKRVRLVHINLDFGDLSAIMLSLRKVQGYSHSPVKYIKKESLSWTHLLYQVGSTKNLQSTSAFPVLD